MAARLNEDGDGLTLATDHGAEALDPGTIEVSSRLASVPRRVTLSDGRLFETADNDGIDRLFAAHPRHGRSGRLAGWEKFRWRLVGLAVAAIVTVAVAVRWGLPLAADATAMLVPQAVEESISEQVLDALDLTLFEESKASAERQANAQAIFARLVEAGSLPPERMKLVFRQGGVTGANALALPGGKIVMTDELLIVAANDDALAGILAHEIGHDIERHGLKRVLRAAGLAAMVTLIAGDVSGVLDQVIAAPAVLLDLAYSRSFELEADDYSISLMLEGGFDPRALADLLESKFAKGESDDGPPSWLTTHPPTAERAARLRAAAAP
jgi:Zn-dependent protease with chaperone function